MSWDIVLIKTDSNQESLGKYVDRAEIPFDKKATILKIQSVLPELDTSNDNWLIFDNERTAMEFNLDEDYQVSIHVHILSDEAELEAVEIINSLCRRLECRAFDTTAGKFM